HRGGRGAAASGGSTFNAVLGDTCRIARSAGFDAGLLYIREAAVAVLVDGRLIRRYAEAEASRLLIVLNDTGKVVVAALIDVGNVLDAGLLNQSRVVIAKLIDLGLAGLRERRGRSKDGRGRSRGEK